MIRTTPATALRLRLLGCALCLGLSVSLAQAGKPEWAPEGKGKPEKHRHADDRQHRDERRGEEVHVVTGGSGVSVQIQIGGYFEEAHRRAAREFYEPRWRTGRCPPGLAKKGNGCRPPGQAKHWRRGEPLPSAIVYYPVPVSVQVRLGTPPPGHKFVRVAADILLIAVGTRMVIDAIEDLGQL